MPEKNLNEASRQAQDLYERGITALERNSLDGAIRYLGEVVTLEPGFLKARQLLRVAEIKKFKDRGALGSFFGSVTGSPALAKAMVNLKKEPLKAMEAAEKALTSNPYNLQALKVLSEAAEVANFPLTAVFAYETAREGNPDNIEVLMELGRLYLASGQEANSRGCYERILQIDPTYGDAFKGLKDATASEAMKKGGWEAATSYRDMIKDTHEAQVLEQAGRIYKDEDVVHAQMAEIFKLAQQEPTNISYRKKLGDLALQINEFDYAIQSYQDAFELTSKTDGILEAAISDAQVKKISHTIREKEKLLEADPTNESLSQEIAALKQEKETTILQDLEVRTKRYPNDLDIKYELAQAYFRNNLIDKAIPEFQAAANNPKNRIACMNWLGQCFREKKMFDLAIQRFKTASEQYTGMDNFKKEIIYNLGATYRQMGKKAEMIDQFKIVYDVDASYKDVSKIIEDYYREQSGTS